MKFAVMSDTHYISRRIQLDKTDEETALQTAVTEKAVLDAASREDIDILLITGDLTDRGDKQSHDDFIAFLHEVRQKTGTKIYVTTATHDFNHGKAYGRMRGDDRVQYKSQPWTLPFFDKDKAKYRDLVTEDFTCMSEEECRPALLETYESGELWELYAPFGREDAFSCCEGGYSYCVALDENTWCLMLNDNFRNAECGQDLSATYTPGCFKWIDSLVKRAKEENKFIFACTHHPLLPPAPAYRIGASDMNMRTAYTGHTLADIGISLAFTGHTHFSNVGYLHSDKGNVLCDVTTPSVRFYPPRYRVVDLDAQNSRLSYQSISVGIPDGFNLPEATLEDHYKVMMYCEYDRKVKNMKPPFNKIMNDMQIKHIYPLCKRACGLTKDEYECIKETRMFDFIIQLAFHMLTGDGSYGVQTAEYKFAMGLSAVLDSIIDAQPFYDIKKKKLKGYSISEIIEPMLFNNYESDNEDCIDFSKMPEEKTQTPVIKDLTGELLMIILSNILLLLPLAVPSSAVALAVASASLAKKLKEKKNPTKPERY